MALGSVLVASVPSPDFVSSAVELESEDFPGAALAVLRSVVAAALLALDCASICRKFGVPPGACAEAPEPELAFAVAPVPPDRALPLDLPLAPLPAALDFPGELDPPAALEPLAPLDPPAALDPPAGLEPPAPLLRPVPLVPPELLEPPVSWEPLLVDLPDAAEVLDPVPALLEPAAVPVPDAAPGPAPALDVPPRAAEPLLEAREAEPVEAGGEGEIDSRPTPMHSVRARAL